MQAFFVDINVPDEEDARREWAVKHGNNFRNFFDSAPEELQERLINAAKAHDESFGRTLIDGFAQFEAGAGDTPLQ